MLGHLTGKKERIWEAYDNHEFWNLTLENPIIQTQETLISDSFSWRLKSYRNNYDSGWLGSPSAGFEAPLKFEQVG